MATRANIPSTLNASMGVDDFILALAAMGQNVTAESALLAVKDLPGGDAGDKIAALCVYSACSVKKVCDGIVTACNLSVPDTWKVDQTVNFSMFAMIGHLMMMLPDSELTPNARLLRPMYTKSIGGSANLVAFGGDGVVPGKAPRTTILREWSTRVKSVDTYKIRKALGAKFPNMVKPVASFRGAGLFYNLFKYVISLVTFIPRLLMRNKLIVTFVLILIPASRPRVLSVVELAARTTARVPIALAKTRPFRAYVQSFKEGVDMIAAEIPVGVKEVSSEAVDFGLGAYKGFKEGNLSKVLYGMEFRSLQQVYYTMGKGYKSINEFFSEEGEDFGNDKGSGDEDVFTNLTEGNPDEHGEVLDLDEL